MTSAYARKPQRNQDNRTTEIGYTTVFSVTTKEIVSIIRILLDET